MIRASVPSILSLLAMECDLDTPPPEWMIEHPETTPLFDQLEIDVSCGGRSLRDACERRGLDPQHVLERLRALIAAET